MKLLELYKLGNVELKNRIVMEPMCMYSVENHDGKATSFHFAHYVNRAIGQVGLIIVEATGIVEEGRITDNCLGIYNDVQLEGLKRIVEGVHEQGSKIGIQLNHAGRKCCAIDGVDTIYGPSAIAFDEKSKEPKAMTKQDIDNVVEAFKQAAIRADKAGFDALEIHGAHGYLISQFMSPISNKRMDEYKDGGLFLEKVVSAVRDVWPKDKILSLRVSATDYEENGQSVNDTIRMVERVKDMIDVLNVSSGGITPIRPHSLYPGYQVDFAIEMKKALQIPIIACGMLGDVSLASYLIESDKVDLIGLARPLLTNPYWVVETAVGRKKNEWIPKQYIRGY